MHQKLRYARVAALALGASGAAVAAPACSSSDDCHAAFGSIVINAPQVRCPSQEPVAGTLSIDEQNFIFPTCSGTASNLVVGVVTGYALDIAMVKSGILTVQASDGTVLVDHVAVTLPSARVSGPGRCQIDAVLGQ